MDHSLKELKRGMQGGKENIRTRAERHFWGSSLGTSGEQPGRATPDLNDGQPDEIRARLGVQTALPQQQRQFGQLAPHFSGYQSSGRQHVEPLPRSDQQITALKLPLPSLRPPRLITIYQTKR